jgi:hypothetical protein
VSKKLKLCLKKLWAYLICCKRPNGHQVVTNEQSYSKWRFIHYLSVQNRHFGEGTRKKIMIKIDCEKQVIWFNLINSAASVIITTVIMNEDKKVLVWEGFLCEPCVSRRYGAIACNSQIQSQIMWILICSYV